MTEHSAHTESSPRTTWGNRALTVAAMVGTLCVLATLISLIFGVRPVLFETGSMAPAVPTGSLGLSRTVPAASVGPGDLVGVVRDDGVRVTHRVESIDAVTGNSVAMTLKGDANARPDPEPYVVTEVTRVYGTMPLLGYVVAWLKNPYTLALQAMGLLALLAIAFTPKQGWRNSPTAQRLAAGSAAATVAVLVAAGMQGSGDAQAALTGQATATGSMQAGVPNNPTSLTCVNTTTTIILLPYATVELRWPNPPGERRIHLRTQLPWSDPGTDHSRGVRPGRPRDLPIPGQCPPESADLDTRRRHLPGDVDEHGRTVPITWHSYPESAGDDSDLRSSCRNPLRHTGDCDRLRRAAGPGRVGPRFGEPHRICGSIRVCRPGGSLEDRRTTRVVVARTRNVEGRQADPAAWRDS